MATVGQTHGVTVQNPTATGTQAPSAALLRTSAWGSVLGGSCGPQKSSQPSRLAAISALTGLGHGEARMEGQLCLILVLVTNGKKE